MYSTDLKLVVIFWKYGVCAVFPQATTFETVVSTCDCVIEVLMLTLEHKCVQLRVHIVYSIDIYYNCKNKKSI